MAQKFRNVFQLPLFASQIYFMLNLTNQRFGRLIAIEIVGKSKNNGMLWFCKCDCGKTKIATTGGLRNKHTQSCGCLSPEKARIRRTTHGDTSYGKCSSENQAWRDMKDRCSNVNNKYYKDYGGRGISVCGRWLHSYENFLEDMGRKPSKQHSLDRIENDKGYYKENCRWATKGQQSGNTRQCIWIEHEGKKLIIADWAKIFKCTSSSLRGMIKIKKSFSEVYNYYINKNIKQQQKYI